MLIRVVTVFSITITICICDNIILPEQYDHSSLDQAISAVNNHRYDVPSSYKYSVLHSHTTPRGLTNVNEYYTHSNPTNLQIQYAPLVNPELRLHKGKYTKLSPSNYLNNGLLGALNINFGETQNTDNTMKTEKKPLEPRLEPENLYTHNKDHPLPSKHIDYIPGHNIEVMRSVDRYPGHNAIYKNSPTEKPNKVNSLNQYVIYPKPKEPDQRNNDQFFQWNSGIGTTRGTTTPSPQSTTITRIPVSSPPNIMQNARVNQYYVGNPDPYAPSNQNIQSKQKKTIKMTKMHSILLNVARKYNQVQGPPLLDGSKPEITRLLYTAPAANTKTKLYPVQRNNLRYAYNYISNS